LHVIAKKNGKAKTNGIKMATIPSKVISWRGTFGVLKIEGRF